MQRSDACVHATPPNAEERRGNGCGKSWMKVLLKVLDRAAKRYRLRKPFYRRAVDYTEGKSSAMRAPQETVTG